MFEYQEKQIYFAQVQRGLEEFALQELEKPLQHTHLPGTLTGRPSNLTQVTRERQASLKGSLALHQR